MSMVYGNDWNRGGEHYTTANQKAAWAQQGQAAQQKQDADFERGREMFERSQVQQEQARRTKETESTAQNALTLGQKKYDVLSGLLGGKMGGKMSGGTPNFAWPYGSGQMRGRV